MLAKAKWQYSGAHLDWQEWYYWFNDEVWVQLATGLALQQATGQAYCGPFIMWYKRIGSMEFVGESADMWRWGQFWNEDDVVAYS